MRKVKGLKSIDRKMFTKFIIPRDMPITTFAEENGLDFEAGRGFYQVTKYVKVHPHKEIVIRSKETGEYLEGPGVRKMLGLQPQTKGPGKVESLSTKDVKEFDIFVQTKSFTRKLIEGTDFLWRRDAEEVAVKPKKVKAISLKSVQSSKKAAVVAVERLEEKIGKCDREELEVYINEASVAIAKLAKAVRC